MLEAECKEPLNPLKRDLFLMHGKYRGGDISVLDEALLLSAGRGRTKGFLIERADADRHRAKIRQQLVALRLPSLMTCSCAQPACRCFGDQGLELQAASLTV